MKEFLDNLREELIEEGQSSKMMMDYIDGRIALMIEEELNSRCYVNIQCVKDEIQNFNDR